MILDIPKKYDIIVLVEENCIRIEFVEACHGCLNFEPYKSWFNKEEFPSFETIFTYLETFHDKPKNWFITNYIPILLDALDRVSILSFCKPLFELAGQDGVNKASGRVLFWLLFLAKELKHASIPEIYSTTINDSN